MTVTRGLVVSDEALGEIFDSLSDQPRMSSGGAVSKISPEMPSWTTFELSDVEVC